MRKRVLKGFASGLVGAALILAAGCGRYGPPQRAPGYRDEGRTVTEATSAMGRGSERADEQDEDE